MTIDQDNMPDFSNHIDALDPACLCPICENDIEEDKRSVVVRAHGCQYLVCGTCADGVAEGEGEAEE